MIISMGWISQQMLRRPHPMAWKGQTHGQDQSAGLEIPQAQDWSGRALLDRGREGHQRWLSGQLGESQDAGWRAEALSAEMRAPAVGDVAVDVRSTRAGCPI